MPSSRRRSRKAVEVGRVVFGKAPRARALDEELDRVDAELGRAVERLLDPAGAVGAEQHEPYATRRVHDLAPGEADYDHCMSVRVRMAPSPTGPPAHRRRPHRSCSTGCSRAAAAGECLLRIENTDTSREVAEATEQIQRSLRWLGIDWDGPVTFQLDAIDRCRELGAAARRGGQGVRGRGRDPLPDARRGRDRLGRRRPRADRGTRTSGSRTWSSSAPTGARPTTSPTRSRTWTTAITHVIRGRDHVSNTPKQLQILARARPRACPSYAHVPDVLGDDGKKLSKRHGATSVDEFRDGRLRRRRR